MKCTNIFSTAILTTYGILTGRIFFLNEKLSSDALDMKKYSKMIMIKMILNERPPLWSSGQSSWLQIRRTGFDSRHYQKKK
jgi:hypothetical protein